MTLQEVANGYGVSKEAVHQHIRRHYDELEKFVNKGMTISDTLYGGNQGNTVVYRDGVIKLGFFIKSKKAASFRQWATNILGDYMDSHNIDMQDVMDGMQDAFARFQCGVESRLENVHANLLAIQEDTEKKLQEVKGAYGSIRLDVDELRDVLNMLVKEDGDVAVLQKLIGEVSQKPNMTKKALIGKVMKMLNVNKVYRSTDSKKVIKCLQVLNNGSDLELIQGGADVSKG
jgi:predicted transcriptional regulator